MGALRDALVDTLSDAGVPATLDPGVIQVPGAWVSPRELQLLTLDGGRRARVHVWLVTADADEVTALDALEVLLDAALGVLAVDTTNDDLIQLAGTLVVRDEGPLPAVQITTTIDL
jgi:hypothetical protein